MPQSLQSPLPQREFKTPCHTLNYLVGRPQCASEASTLLSNKTKHLASRSRPPGMVHLTLAVYGDDPLPNRGRLPTVGNLSLWGQAKLLCHASISRAYRHAGRVTGAPGRGGLAAFFSGCAPPFLPLPREPSISHSARHGGRTLGGGDMLRSSSRPGRGGSPSHWCSQGLVAG